MYPDSYIEPAHKARIAGGEQAKTYFVQAHELEREGYTWKAKSRFERGISLLENAQDEEARRIVWAECLHLLHPDTKGRALKKLTNRLVDEYAALAPMRPERAYYLHMSLVGFCQWLCEQETQAIRSVFRPFYPTRLTALALGFEGVN